MKPLSALALSLVVVGMLGMFAYSVTGAGIGAKEPLSIDPIGLVKDTVNSVFGLPDAEFSGDPVEGSSPLAVQFTDLSNDSSSWNWNFGDGETSDMQNPEHTYANPGVYTVSLTVSNDGESDTETKEEYIAVADGNYENIIVSPGDSVIHAHYAGERLYYYSGEHNRTYISYAVSDDGTTTGDYSQYITYYDHDNESLGPQVLVASASGDNHLAGTIAVDSDGYIHMFYGGHAFSDKPMTYIRSKNPEEIESLSEGAERGEEVSIESTSWSSYTQMTIDKFDTVYLFYRKRGAADVNSNEGIFAIKEKGGNFTKIILTKGSGGMGTYPLYGLEIDDENALSQDDVAIHITYHWHDGSSNIDRGYAVSRDGGQTWEKSNGAQYSLPITHSSAETVQPTPSGDTIGGSHFTLDADKNPFLITSHVESGQTVEIYQVRYDSGFQEQEFVVYGNRPRVILKDDVLWIYYTNSPNAKQIRRISSEDNGKTWSDPEVVYITEGSSAFSIPSVGHLDEIEMLYEAGSSYLRTIVFGRVVL